MDRIEQKQLEQELHFEQVFQALETGPQFVSQGAFFEGQTFDAYSFTSDLIRSAQNSIQLIDNYIDDTVLLLLAKRGKGVKATVYTRRINKLLEQDLLKYNTQYESIDIKQFDQSHDRFLVIDQKTVYHLGASLKDLGKQWFAFSIIERDSITFLERINKL